MKRSAIVVLTVVLSSTFSFGQIAGSGHDFSSSGWTTGEQICEACHTPHNADNTVTLAPLWNHEMTVATFNPYTNGSLDATVGQPDGISKLCLSCHDGSVALDNFGGATGGTNFITSTNGDLLDTDLGNDHPVSFTYDAALATADGELYDPTTQNTSLGGTIDTDLLNSNKMECSSCHDVHNNNNGNFLIMSNSGSALCITCHNK